MGAAIEAFQSLPSELRADLAELDLTTLNAMQAKLLTGGVGLEFRPCPARRRAAAVLTPLIRAKIDTEERRQEAERAAEALRRAEARRETKDARAARTAAYLKKEMADAYQD